MLSFFFGSKKPKETPGKPASSSSNHSSQIESLTENARTPGDVETYTFTPPIKPFEATFRTWDPFKPPADAMTFSPSVTEILNEAIIAELLAKHTVKPAPPFIEKRRKSSTSSEGDETSLTNLKAIKESLSRIARYNNKRKYDERLGFASTLSSKAEEIGRGNTIKFLLKVIDEHLVNFFV